MNATAVQAMTPRTFVSESSSLCSGDRTRATEVSIVAIRPISVSMPVAVTTIAAGAAGHGGVLEEHVRPVAERDVAARQDGRVLGDRRALAGERRLLCLERRRAEDPAVGGHDVAGLQLDDVAGDDVARRHRRDLPVAEHACLRDLHLRQRVDARPRLELLPGAEHEVEQDQERDDDPGRRPRR